MAEGKRIAADGFSLTSSDGGEGVAAYFCTKSRLRWRLAPQALIGRIDLRKHALGVAKQFLWQAQCGEPVWMIGLGEGAPDRLYFFWRRICGDAEDETGVFGIEAARILAVARRLALFSADRINPRNLPLEKEGVSALGGLDFDKGRIVAQGLAQGVMRGDQDRAALTLARPHS